MFKRTGRPQQNKAPAPWLDMLMHWITALMLSAGLLLPLLSGLGVAYSPVMVVLSCAGILAAFQVVGLNKWTRRLGIPALIAGLLFLILSQGALLRNLPAVLSLLLQGQPLGLQLFSGTLSLMIALVMASLAYALVRQDSGFYMALLLVLAVLMTLWFYGERDQLLYCLPALGALLMLFARSSDAATPYARSFPLVLVVLVLSLLILPGGEVSSPTLKDAASRLRDRIYDYFFFTEPRSVYSLVGDGYQPLGQDRLGGPANLSANPVMQVRTDRTVLLRGTIKGHYTGLAFVDAGSSRRYLMVDPRWNGLRRQLLDMEVPVESLRENSAVFTPQQISVLMAAPGVSTLFMPQRFEGMEAGENMVPYFNVTSEIFITRDTTPGDTYTVQAYPFTSSTGGLAQAIAAAALQDPEPAHSAQVLEDYLQLPGSVGGDLYALAERITQGQEGDFAKAQAILQYLQSNYPYSLDQNVPPENRDFVSWFLMEEQRGYCTSFAASMVVLARCAGIPARYIEGYVASPTSNGIAYVTGEDAHAWAEIYFPGFGWVPFDATPGHGSNSENDSENNQPPPMEDGGDDEDPPPEAPESDPTPEPSPPPEDAQDPEPIPPDAEEPTPTPVPEHAQPEDQDTPESGSLRRIWPWILLGLLLLLAVAALILRLRFTNPTFLSGRTQDSGQKLLIWYRALQRELQAYGLSLDTSNSPLKSFEDAEKALRRPDLLMPVAIAVCFLQYGGRPATNAALRQAEFAYGALRTGMGLRRRLRHLYLRLRFGLGNLKSIP